MKRVLTELTPECEVTAQMFISGMKRKRLQKPNAGHSVQ